MNARVNPEEKDTPRVVYVDSLPDLNETDGFLAIKTIGETLPHLWMEFVELTLRTLVLYSEAGYAKSIPDFLEGKIGIDELPSPVKTQIGMVKEINVIDVHETGDGHFTAKMNMDFQEMVRIYYERPKGPAKNGYNTRAIIDRFFGYLWARNLLLYPICPPENYSRPSTWKLILSASLVFLGEKAPLFEMMKRHIDPDSDNSQKARQTRMNAMSNLMVATTWRSPDDITEESLRMAESVAMEKLVNRRAILRFTKSSINNTRQALIKSGRGDIWPPRRVAKEKLRSGRPFPSFIPVPENTCEAILELLEKGESYLDFLRHEGLSAGSISTHTSNMNTLFRYMLDIWPDIEEVDTPFVDRIYDPQNPDSLHEYIRKNGTSEHNYGAKMRSIAGFFDFCGIFSPRAGKNIPRGTGVKHGHPARRAMPAEMVRHIHEIIIERPPMAPAKWDRNKADSSWWPHDVWPVYPILFLFLYCIPLRGGQARHLCRKRSFVFSEDGQRLEKFVINTDKNVHRQELLEIPCAWDELQIFVPFLMWHKKYFPHLEKVVYNDDENSPWEDIEPLMILPNEHGVISRNSMMDYHKRLLCLYQLEKMEEAKRRGDDDYPVVAWSKTGRDFFKSFDELDRAGTNRMRDIQVSYDIHSLRVTGATRYMEAGLGIPHLMMLTGHTTPDVLLSIYIRLTDEERRRELSSAIDNIDFSNRKTAIESGKTFIRKEMVEAYRAGPEEMKKALEANGLFSPERKGYSRGGRTGDLPAGVEMAGEMHPTTWRPMVHGICPGAKCPDGRENRCSLCPHFITGKLFVDGLVLMTNQLLARFQRRTLQIMEEREKGYTSPARAEEQEMVLEEILGYHEILERIERGFASGESGNAPLPVPSGGKRILTEKIPETMAYLRNEWEAGLFGVERDRYGMKLLTVEAMKVAASSGDAGMAGELADSPEKAIDYLMNHYSRKPGEIRGGVDVCEFIRKIGYRPMERSAG